MYTIYVSKSGSVRDWMPAETGSPYLPANHERVHTALRMAGMLTEKFNAVEVEEYRDGQFVRSVFSFRKGGRCEKAAV